MTTTEDLRSQLAALARDLPPSTADPVATVNLRVRRRRHRAQLATAAALVACVTAAAGVWAMSPRPAARHVTAGATSDGAAQETPPASSDVTFQGVAFSLPAGWTSAKPGCGRPSDKTVVAGFFGASCPGTVGPTRPSSWVQLTPVFGPQFVDGFSGNQIDWKGQTAWLSAETGLGVTTLRLSVPRLNAVVEAGAPGANDARALLDQARPQPTEGLGVPSDASSLFIEGMGGTDGDGLQHNVTLTSPADVSRVLDDLRNAAPVSAGTPACDGSWYPHTALLTVHRNEPTERTFAVRLDACSQVVSGTGSAAVVSDTLRADILRLLPNSSLIA